MRGALKGGQSELGEPLSAIKVYQS